MNYKTFLLVLTLALASTCIGAQELLIRQGGQLAKTGAKTLPKTVVNPGAVTAAKAASSLPVVAEKRVDVSTPVIPRLSIALETAVERQVVASMEPINTANEAAVEAKSNVSAPVETVVEHQAVSSAEPVNPEVESRFVKSLLKKFDYCSQLEPTHPNYAYEISNFTNGLALLWDEFGEAEPGYDQFFGPKKTYIRVGSSVKETFVEAKKPMHIQILWDIVDVAPGDYLTYDSSLRFLNVKKENFFKEYKLVE